MKIGVTTLGCPGWDLDTICRRGQEYGFDGVDFRGLKESLDITVLPEFTERLAKTKAKLADAGLSVGGISTSIRICEKDWWEQNLEEARQTIPLALELGVAAVRVFGMGDVEAHSREELADMGQRTMEAILGLQGARQLRWLVETHDIWTSSADCKLLLDRIPDPAFGILWDIGHTPRVSKEAPAETLRVLGDRIHYLHIKDAVYDTSHPQTMKDGWRYVLPGTGQLPLVEALGLLRERGYDGWLIFEHEKRWHPELPEPEEAFPKFATWIRSL